MEVRRESSEETEEEILQKQKQYLIQDVTEEIEHLTKQLAVVNENVQRILKGQGEVSTFAQQWGEFQSQCKQNSSGKSS